jgi:hypothetical protein
VCKWHNLPYVVLKEQGKHERLVEAINHVANVVDGKLLGLTYDREGL